MKAVVPQVKARELGISYALARQLRAFTRKDERPSPLKSVLVTPEFLVATNGHALVEVSVEETIQGLPKTEDGLSWLIHRDKLLLVRKKSELLAINMATGDLEVRGEGETYPLRLPAAPRNGDGMTYPKYGTILDEADKIHAVATLGINPELTARVVALTSGSRGTKQVILEVPPNAGHEDHVQTCVPFRVSGRKVRGLLMPMRVR